MFGDESQESAIRCCGAIQWIGNVVVVLPNWDASRRTFQLLFYPRYHLDRSSITHQAPPAPHSVSPPPVPLHRRDRA